jgi:hypothetical protein
VRRDQAPIVESFDGWREYERRKQEWIAAHPEAPPREYEQAMRRLANECGV